MPMIVRPGKVCALLLLALALFIATSHRARAQTVSLSCTVAISDIAFGSFDVLTGTSVTSNGTLSVSCLNITATTGNLYVCVAIPTRSMVGSGATTLAYDVYGPNGAATSWSNTTPIVIPFASLRLNQAYTQNVQATVSGSQQTKPPDTYSQTLSATASYGSTSCTTGLANTATLTFHATATVAKSCNVSATNLGFGSVSSLAALVDGQSTLSLQCSKGTGYTIALDGGLSGATDPTARKMVSGSDSVVYGLYQNSARSTPWGTTATLGGTGTSATQSIPVYGRVPAQATPTVGSYSDTIVVTITY